MAATFSEEEMVVGRIISCQGDTSYATGGYALPAGAVPPGRTAIGLNTGTIIALISGSNVKFVTAATGAEVANASDQSAVTTKAFVQG